MEILREPLGQLEVRFPLGPVAPNRRDLAYLEPEPVSLGDELERELEPVGRFDPDASKKRGRIGLERVGCVTRPHPSEPMQRQSRESRKQPFEPRTAHL